MSIKLKENHNRDMIFTHSVRRDSKLELLKTNIDSVRHVKIIFKKYTISSFESVFLLKKNGAGRAGVRRVVKMPLVTNSNNRQTLHPSQTYNHPVLIKPRAFQCKPASRRVNFLKINKETFLT